MSSFQASCRARVQYMINALSHLYCSYPDLPPHAILIESSTPTPHPSLIHSKNPCNPSYQPRRGVLLPSDRLLVRALCKDGCIHEVAVRIETTALGLDLGGLSSGLVAGLGTVAATHGSVAVVLRLEHHVLLTNSTGYPLALLQPTLDTAPVSGLGERGSLYVCVFVCIFCVPGAAM